MKVLYMHSNYYITFNISASLNRPRIRENTKLSFDKVNFYLKNKCYISVLFLKKEKISNPPDQVYNAF